MTAKQKGKFRWGTIASMVVAILTATAEHAGKLPPKIALPIEILASAIAGAKKSAVREEHERTEMSGNQPGIR